MPDDTDINTPSATDAPARQRKIRDTSALTRKTGRQVRGSVLMPWMCAYAEWLILECLEPPRRVDRIRTARGLARAPVGDRHLYLVEEREDFLAYCDELRKGPLEAARAKFASAFPTYVARHREALDLATDAKDYTAMARIAEPVLDRVMPKKAEAGVVATQVIIQLTDAQVRGVQPGYEAPPLLISEVPPSADDASAAP